MPAVDWLVPVGAGLLQAAGVFFINKALQFKNTGIANAIFATPETCYKKSPITAEGLDFRGRFGKLFWSILAYYS